MPPFSSLFIFSSTNPLRSWAYSLAFARWFENFVLVCIVISSALLAIEDPVHENAQINKNLRFTDYLFTTVFTIEMLLKLVALGVVLHPGSYIRDPWNVLDALVVIISLADLFLSVSLPYIPWLPGMYVWLPFAYSCHAVAFCLFISTLVLLLLVLTSLLPSHCLRLNA